MSWNCVNVSTRPALQRLVLWASGLALLVSGARLTAVTAESTPPVPEPSAAGQVDFGQEILPILADRCFKCHGAQRHEGGLRLDVRRRALQGGDSGPAIVPGSGATSRLVQRVTAEDRAMPPDGDRLTELEVAHLRAWIEGGAEWPDDLAGTEEELNHWAFQPIERPVVPPVSGDGWGRHDLDAFVLARLEREGIRPSPPADRRTLVRRLSLDLLGLPPTPGEVRAFLEDPADDAWERLVDRLLESPHFGERWGRHWLDLARYADSDGYENDNPRPHAWRYRDWVIDAVNRDLPLDRFTIEQVAGDLLPGAAEEQKIATGFHRNTLSNSAGGADQEEFRDKAVKDRTDTAAAVWMGLTFNCCQCHSHKYDPIAHREYYGFYAFFNETDNHDLPVSGGMAQTVQAAQRPTRVHRRGNFLDPRDEVTPHTPAFLPPLEPRGARADRLDLARWLVRRDHPLTARVAVNRAWQHLFGQGLVATPENFGVNGEPPSHRDLLDWLAHELMEPGAGSASDAPPRNAEPWSRKGLIRTIVTSATYRQASRNREELAERDPSNALLARQNRFRIDAEIVRDVALSVSGLLDPALGGPSVQPPLPKGLSTLRELKNERFREAEGERHRRGVYIHVQRTFPYPMLAAFDATDGNQSCYRRERTTTPMQALILLNDPVFVECAEALGRRLRQADVAASLGGPNGRDDALRANEDSQSRNDPSTLARLRHGFELCLTRPPDEAELAALVELLEDQRALDAGEEAAWTGVARTLLNLDEFITRE